MLILGRKITEESSLESVLAEIRESIRREKGRMVADLKGEVGTLVNFVKKMALSPGEPENPEKRKE